MLTSLAVANYRSLLKFATPLSGLNLITGQNGSGKSNLYRSLRLLADTASGGVIQGIASEGGLESTFWAGPEQISRSMRSGESPVQGTVRNKRLRMRLGFVSDDFGYSISFGLPQPGSKDSFAYDPEIKRECIWVGERFRPAALLVDRTGPVLKVRRDKSWDILRADLTPFDSFFSTTSGLDQAPEIFRLREEIRSWRFYDHFRTDRDSPARQPQLATFTPALHHDGRDLASAWETISMLDEVNSLAKAVSLAFPGSKVSCRGNGLGRIELLFHQHGLLRPLSSAELSDGTLRYLLWAAALLTRRPPSLMVLNEPETSMHPDLLPALAQLILDASSRTQVWVISHSPAIIEKLRSSRGCQHIELVKDTGETRLAEDELGRAPAWKWPDTE